MRSRFVAGFILACACVGFIAIAPRGSIALATPRHISPCGPPPASHEVQEPPSVDMWEAPVDANGLHELILAVHHDGEAYCYRYTWNGTAYDVPPTIRVRRGERFALRVVNDMNGQSMGETVASTAMLPCGPVHMPMGSPVLHWVGYLNHTIDDRNMPITDADTNLHLHGFEGPELEENVFLSTLSTPLHACEYEVTIPRTQPPGTYLYHPHAHGSSDDTVAGGLDGAWIVEPDTPELPRSDEHVLVIRYRIPYVLDNNFAPAEHGLGRLAKERMARLRPAPPVAYDPFNPPPWPVSYPMTAGGLTLDATGCNGVASEALVDVDGALTPATLAVPAGETQLLRIVNGTSDSAKLLMLRDAAGHVVPLEVAGVDGVPVSGDMEHPFAGYLGMQSLMLSPMSRADVLLTAAPGASYTLSSEPYCQGKDGFYQMHHDLLRISAGTSAPHATALQATPLVAGDSPAARLVAFARAHPKLIHRRAITFTEYDLPKAGEVPAHQAYYITDTTNPNFHEHPFWPSFARGSTVTRYADIIVKQGTIEEWYIVNATMETHAFHIHQMAFVEEKSFEGVPLTVDTVFVPVGSLLPNRRDPNYPLVKPSITRVILDFRHVPKGTFVFHCHMLYHEDRGMMGVIRVE